MIKYAIILLDKISTSFCHADNTYSESELIPLDTLRSAIRWCMKENLRIQFVYPDYELPQEYLYTIDSIDHADIKHKQHADVAVYNGWREFANYDDDTSAVIIRLYKTELFDNRHALLAALSPKRHISIVIIDIETFSHQDMETYQQLLSEIATTAKDLIVKGKMPQISILTDRLMLSAMNNCNAGEESITIAPNGKFYVCPAFYYENAEDNVGNLIDGLNIRNSQLYKLTYAPMCRNCDAWHCRRCVWLNRKTTLEVNTPSHEQCVVSHLERNSAHALLNSVRQFGEFLPGTEIPEIDYLDPFDKIIKTYH